MSTDVVDWKLCYKYDMDRSEKWHEHQLEGVVENERCKILWDMTIYSVTILSRPEDLTWL